MGWACVHFPCCCCCSCSMRISVATRHFVLAKIWAMAEKRRRAEHQWRSEWQPAIADSREELALFFRVQWAFPLSTAQFPCQFSTRFWMLNVSLGCLRVSACNSASCKNMQIRHQKCFNENSACGKKKKKNETLPAKSARTLSPQLMYISCYVTFKEFNACHGKIDFAFYGGRMLIKLGHKSFRPIDNWPWRMAALERSSSLIIMKLTPTMWSHRRIK